MLYKGLKFEFQNAFECPKFGLSNSLKTMDPLFIKFYRNSYQSFTKYYLSRISENFGQSFDNFLVSVRPFLGRAKVGS